MDIAPGEDGTPDYSSYADNDIDSAAHDYSDLSDEHRQDLLPDDYKRETFGSRFGDAYKQNQADLAAREQGEGRGDAKTNPRDIGKQERAAKQPAWKTSLEATRQNAQAAAQNKPGGFFVNHKKGIAGGMIGIFAFGSVSFLALPGIAIGEFGQMAGWLKNTTQTVHDLAVGARSMRNVMVSARHAANAAIKGTISSHVKTSRVGMFGQAVGDNYVKQLKEVGIDIKASTLAADFQGMELDMDKITGTEKFSNPNLSEEAKLKMLKERFPNLPESALNAGSFEGPNFKIDGRMKYKDLVKTLSTMDSVVGTSKTRLGAAIKVRYTARMLGIYSWLHPIENLKGKTREDIRKAAAERKKAASKKGQTESLRSQEPEEKEVPNEDGEGTHKEETDRSKTGRKTLDELAGNVDTIKGKGISPKVTKGLQFAGKAGGIAGLVMIVVCSIKAAKDNFQANMKALTESMSSVYQATQGNWSQIQSAFLGEDREAIDMDVLAVEHEDYYNDKIPVGGEMDENGNVITPPDSYIEKSWSNAPSYQATVNDNLLVSHDRDPDQMTTMYTAGGGWAAKLGAFLGDGFDLIADAMCSKIASFLAVGIGILADLVPPGLGLVIQAIMLLPPVEDAMASIISSIFQMGTGIPLDVSLLDPDQRAEVGYRAGQFMSNTKAASEGGVVVNSVQAYENQLIAQEYLDAEWRARPLAERLFDATDYRSTVARVVNGAGINTMPSGVKGYFANFAKLVGAVPGFIFNGLLNNRSTEAKAAWGTYDLLEGQPTVQLTTEFMDKILDGEDESWDWDQNAEKVFDLLDKGDTYRTYAKQCLNLEIGTEEDLYKVTAYDPEDPADALMVGINGSGEETDENGDPTGEMINVSGSWGRNACAEKVNPDSDAYKEEYVRVALYAGMDYPSLAGYAWLGSDDDDPETQKIAAELFGDTAASSGGDGSGSGEGDGSGSGDGSGGDGSETSGGDGGDTGGDGSGSCDGGDDKSTAIGGALNANRDFFNGQPSDLSAKWNDSEASMQNLLDNYGQLAVRLGNKYNIPYVAVLVQMRWEDPNSVCGHNNFWGNGCPPGTGTGGSSIKAANLSEGFEKYGQTLTNGNHNQALGVKDPKEFLEKIGHTWIYGPNNPDWSLGYGNIEDMKKEVDVLINYINKTGWNGGCDA